MPVVAVASRFAVMFSVWSPAAAAPGHGNIDRGERRVCVDHAVDCRVAHHIKAVRGHHVAVRGPERNCLPACIVGAAAIADNEEAIAIEGNIGGIAGGVDRALREVRLVGATCTPAPTWIGSPEPVGRSADRTGRQNWSTAT